MTTKLPQQCSNTKAKKAGSNSLLQRNPSPILAATIILVLVFVLGSGAFYAYNGGWKTDSQKDFQFQHEMMPLMQASKGIMGPLERENQRRKANGQPPLEVPKDHQATAQDNRQAIADLQQKLNSAKGNSPTN